MGEPTGGEKDNLAPEIIPEKTFPANGTVNFTGEKISISFDEYITVRSQQVIITPALAKKPTIKAKGKRLEIIFQEPLTPNTTYTINLSGAITDITENNLTQNMQYVMSTGPFLDSLGISGKVVDAYTQGGVSGTTVILHPAETDSAIFKSKPAYFLKTAKDGSFSFFNLKTGSYRIYAINDLNADLLFSQHPEDIAFLDTLVQLDTNVSGILLRQFKPEEKIIRLRSSANISKYVQVYRYNKLLPDVNTIPLNASENVLKFNAKQSNDSVFYMSLYDTLRTDTLKFIVRSGNDPLDTLNFTAHLSRKTGSKAGYKLVMGPEVFITDSIFVPAAGGCTADVAKIELTDTLHKKPVAFKVKTGFQGCSIFPETPTEKIPLKVTCLPGAFTALITGEKNDTLKGMANLMPVEKTGNIQLTIKGLEEKNIQSPVCVLMLDNNRIKKVRIDKNKPVMVAEYLKPGNYTFFLFDDADGNGEWSPGDFNKKIQPENIYRYNQSVKVKANWDQDLTWVL